MNARRTNQRDEKNYYKYEQFGKNPMPPHGPVGIISLAGSASFSECVDSHLVSRRRGYLDSFTEGDVLSPGFIRNSYRIPVSTLRFSTGEGKAVIESTVRGHDIYVLCDITNHSITYRMRGAENHMSPDDHYQDLKRVILAASGKARRVNVIMPFLYEGRQHRRNSRESLDCAYMLEELEYLGVQNIITFDAHDDRVANAVPTVGFESIPSVYQVLKGMVRMVPDMLFDHGKTMVVSPDEGGITRAVYYASMLGIPLGTFYKRRDYTRVVSGRNPIIAHEFLGDSVEGLDLIIVDDMISSGDSMLDLARSLKAKNARRIFCVATFGLFTDGIEPFNEAYREGIISRVFTSNLVYQDAATLAAPWHVSVDMSRFIALIIDALNHNASISSLVDPTDKIRKLLNEFDL